jgi:hypothetical protein
MMHPDMAYQLARQRQADLIAAVAHQRFGDEAEHAHPGFACRIVARRWWVLRPSRALS